MPSRIALLLFLFSGATLILGQDVVVNPPKPSGNLSISDFALPFNDTHKNSTTHDEPDTAPTFIGCISSGLFTNVGEAAVDTGNGELTRAANTRECLEHCQQAQPVPPFIYAYYRPHSHRCLCTNVYASATATQVGEDRSTKRCHHKSANGYHLASAFKLKACYDHLSPAQPPAVNAVYADRPHQCLDSCAVSDQPVQNYTVTRTAMQLSRVVVQGIEGWWYACQCYGDHTRVHGVGRERCKVGSGFFYARRG